MTLMLASGFAGLGYQLVWTQQSALWLGHEAAAVLAVVAAFFGGLSLGACWLGPLVESSRRPVRWYAACELGMALWALLLTLGMAPVSERMLQLTGAEPTAVRQWSVAFLGTFLLLLPATAAMGATLPAMQRIAGQWQRDGRNIAALYAANTFGAVLGVLTVAFWLIPQLGLARSTLLCALINLACAGTAFVALPASFAVEPKRVRGRHRSGQRELLLRLAASGLLGIGYEVLVVRVLCQVTEDTVYTFALLLAVYLVGSAAGAAAYQSWLSRRQQLKQLNDALFSALGAACLIGMSTLWTADRARTLGTFGVGSGSAIFAEAVPALFAFALPTIVMGASFSHLARMAQAAGIGFGRALGANTFGATLAPALFGVLVAPTLGPKLGLALIAVGYLSLIRPKSWLLPSVWLPAAALLSLAVFARPLAFVDVPEGGRVASYREGIVAAVSVVEDASGVKRLRINNRAQEGSSATQHVDGRQAWLPLLLHPAPGRALFLGLGTGVTAASAAEDDSLTVEAVELLPEVIAASREFAAIVDRGNAYPRLHLRAADARRYVRTSSRSYDVIVADNYHPARSGSGSLYTVEHFTAVRARLDRDGIFCQWLPLHQLDRDTLRSIVQSFLAVYPDASALLANNSLETPVLGLIGQRDPKRFEPAQLRARLKSAPPSVASRGLEDELAVLGSFVAGPNTLRRLADGAVANTDDRPVVAYRAPHANYAPESSAVARLEGLLGEVSAEVDELVSASAPASFDESLTRYWRARRQFIESGRGVRPSSRVEEMLAQVREPLLAVLHTSPDFRPAYDPLFAMATVLARSNAAGARELLVELSRLQPRRDEAARALTLLGAAPSADLAHP
jgi:spermidine synthase